MSGHSACIHEAALKQLPYLLLQHGCNGSTLMLRGVTCRTGTEPRPQTLHLPPYTQAQRAASTQYAEP